MKSIIQLNQPTVFERVIVLIAMHIIQSLIWLRGDDKLIGFNQLNPKTLLDSISHVSTKYLHMLHLLLQHL